ncbi:MAG: methylated-DNA--[protein]-cysteine S-methyltransferase [Saprospiraceae bacterium]|nr:methylated-DNA--[protein]-cysteine S-methyltransferase [Saprospiraceae bacterium]
MIKTYYNSPIGRFVIKGNGGKITSLRIEEETKHFSGQLPHYITLCINELDAYFKNELERFSVDLDFNQGTKFQRKVWSELLNIPYGKTTTYLNIAQKVSTRNAVRAVGRCIGQNPFAIIAPCHRVIGSDGSLTGFAYGLETKRWLLELEKSKFYGIQNKLF